MKVDEYQIWDYNNPGISFSLTWGRITIFKTTLKELGFPEYIHFMCNMDRRKFAIEACGLDDPGGHRLTEPKNRESCDVKCLELMRYIFRGCGWKEKVTYRVAGKLDPVKKRVEFDLSEAFEIVEGRLRIPALDGTSFEDEQKGKTR